MMTALILSGLVSLVLIIWRPLSIIPISFALYFLSTTYIPTYLGYAVSYEYVIGKEAYVLAGVGKEFLLVVMEGEKSPRLIKIEPSEEAEEAAKKAKEGATIIRFGGKGGQGGDSDREQGGGTTSVKIVDLKDSKMLTKEDYNNIP